MSKMTRPEMQVIRFAEQDVIATSGEVPTSFGLTNFNKTVIGDGTISFDGRTYDSSNYSSFLSALTGYGYASDVKIGKSSPDVFVSNLLKKEFQGTGTYEKNWDGTYNYNGSFFSRQ